MFRAVLCVSVLIALAAASSRRFETHPHIQCSACHAVAAEIGSKMNETAKVRSSVKKGHRLAGKNKVTYQDYESSELRAIEIMEKICPSSLGDYQLRIGSDNVRTLSKDAALRGARFYGRADRDQLDNVVPRLKDFCFSFLDEFDELVVSTIKTERSLDAVTDRICFGAAKVCGTAKVDKARKAEMAKFEKADAKRKAEEAKRAEADKADKDSKAEENEQPPAASEATTPPTDASTEAGAAQNDPAPAEL